MRKNKPLAVCAIAASLLLSPALCAYAAPDTEASQPSAPAAPAVAAVAPGAAPTLQTTDDAQPSELVVKLEPNSADQSAVPPPQEPDNSSIISSAIGRIASGARALAVSFLGTPYRWGGTTPAAFDCSGFTRYLYAKLGVQLPRTAREQYKAGATVKGCNLKTGDLVFFDMHKGYVSHVGMYIGNNSFIHAANPRKGVRIDRLAGTYARCLVGARRYAES